MKLYHGSIVTVKRPNILVGRATTDFGRGFYTTTSLEQATKWAYLKMRRSHATKAIVSVYDAPDNLLDCEFTLLRFDGATKAWLDFVVANRRESPTPHYDLITGPVANDQLYATIRLYEQGVITANAAIEMLKTHTLFDQISFHNPNATALLTFIESL